jgi:hypothetical protein
MLSKQNPALRLKCRTVEGLKYKSVHNSSLKVMVQGPAVRPTPCVCPKKPLLLLLLFYFCEELVIYVQNSAYIKFVRYNLTSSHLHHICNYWLTKHSISYVIFVFYLHTKFHMPSSNGSLIITIKLIDKEDFHIITMLFFYSLWKNYINKYCIS